MEKVVVGRAGFDLLGCTGFYIEPESMEILKCSIKNGCILTDGKVTVSDNGSGIHIHLFRSAESFPLLCTRRSQGFQNRTEPVHRTASWKDRSK